MAKKDYKKIAADIIQVVGGEENIASASHCMTRLRLHLKNENKLNAEEAKKIPGVLNLIRQSGEDQFVIGQDVAQLYEEVSKYNITLSGSVEDATAAAEDNKASKGNVVNAILSFIGGTFSPVIPVLVAGGLMGAVLTLLTTFFGVSTESGTYQVIYAINQATFYFLPVYIGYAAATRLKSNGYLGAFLAAILLYVTINPLKDSTFLGIPISVVSYNSTVFPIIWTC